MKTSSFEKCITNMYRYTLNTSSGLYELKKKTEKLENIFKRPKV